MSWNSHFSSIKLHRLYKKLRYFPVILNNELGYLIMDLLDGVYYGCVGIFMFVVLFQILEQTCCISCFHLDHSISKNHQNNEDFGQDFELERLVWMADCIYIFDKGRYLPPPSQLCLKCIRKFFLIRTGRGLWSCPMICWKMNNFWNILDWKFFGSTML